MTTNDTQMMHDLEGKTTHGRVGTEAAAVVSGAAIGALFGAIAGPAGMAAGAVIGSAAGALAGVAIARTEGEHDADQRDIDAIEAQADAEIVRRSSFPPPARDPRESWERQVEDSLRL